MHNISSLREKRINGLTFLPGMVPVFTFKFAPEHLPKTWKLTQESILAKSSKREWEKTGGKSVFSFLGSIPTLTALLASLNFCFHTSQDFASNVFAIRLIPNGRSQPTRLQLACPAPTGTIGQPIKLAAKVRDFLLYAKPFWNYFSRPFCLYTECIKKIAIKG